MLVFKIFENPQCILKHETRVFIVRLKFLSTNYLNSPSEAATEDVL